MLKLLRSIAITSPILLLSAGVVHAEQTQETPTPQSNVSPLLNPGVCGQVYGLSGRSVILPGGEFQRLEDYCASVEATVVPIPVVQGGNFWQAFLAVASPEAVDFARAAGPDDVVAYGQTICPNLRGGGSMQDVRAEQIRGGLPASFDAAVNVAAINTYCPEYQAQIGR
jgi:hypothetical protein